MFIPSSFRISDHDALLAFIERYGFATLVSTDAAGVPSATHVPLLLDRPANVLLGHIARANPQWEMFDDRESLAIFHGPRCLARWHQDQQQAETADQANSTRQPVAREPKAGETSDNLSKVIHSFHSRKINQQPVNSCAT